MSWIALTEENVLDRLADDERDSYEAAGEATDPPATPRLPGIMGQVTAKIREAIEQNPSNYVGAAGTLPPGGILHAATMCRGLLITSQPTNEGETTPRMREEREAWEWLKRIEDKKVTFNAPVEAPRDAGSGSYGGKCLVDF